MPEKKSIDIQFSLTDSQKKSLEVDPGSCFLELYRDQYKDINELCKNIVGVLHNNKPCSLNDPIFYPGTVIPIIPSSSLGENFIRSTLIFMLAAVVKDLGFDKQVVIGDAIGHSIYYQFSQGTNADIKSITEKMNAYKEAALPITTPWIPFSQLKDKISRPEEVSFLLETQNTSQIQLNSCGSYAESKHTSLLPNSSCLPAFGIEPFRQGFLLHFPKKPDFIKTHEFKDIPALSNIYEEYKEWGQILGVHTIGHLNTIVKNKQIKEFMWVAEALHGTKISEIAKSIAMKNPIPKFVLVAGPSSSGKTTFAKKLQIQLRVQRLEPYLLSLDDYFVDRERTPLQENGKYDFENIKALDIDLLNKNLLELMEGKEASLPGFDFRVGKQLLGKRKLQLPKQGILIIEGIHGLNDELTPLIPKEQKYKVYVSALSQINIDSFHRLRTSDNRLLRRLVRDFRYRGHSANATLDMWPSVRRGEDRNIFPFQNSADSLFNSALDYELGVIRTLAEPILKQVKPENDHYPKALQLLEILDLFLPIHREFVPDQSILREFIGGSIFKY